MARKRAVQTGLKELSGEEKTFNMRMQELTSVGVFPLSVWWNLGCFVAWGCGLLVQFFGASYSLSWCAFFLQTFASYMSFVGVHDSAHGTASSSPLVNYLCGTLSTLVMLFPGSWDLWSGYHLDHHRFANDEHKDPDEFAKSGFNLPGIPAVLRAFLSVCVVYPLRFVGQTFFGEKPPDIRQQLAFWTHIPAMLVAVYLAHHFRVGYYFWWWYGLPDLIAVVMLSFLFGVLPHQGRHQTPWENKLRTTYNLVHPLPSHWLLDGLFTLFFQFQNLHGSHHYLAKVPSYRYPALQSLLEDKYGKHCIETCVYPDFTKGWNFLRLW